ncbi:alpha-1,4-N-acetylglucosaminyltransferase-like [Procambarus clarkii]|uniref:alpha-1,4-N-acetylglucosaminyltransferase-like n=1 Tax=Procambarus clarkii TaxID=6728 RepID=UPI003743D858
MFIRRKYIIVIKGLTVLILLTAMYSNFIVVFQSKNVNVDINVDVDMNVSVGVDNWVIHLCPKYSLLNTSIINQTLHWRSPTPNTIFFTDTSCGINFTPRQACAVESAAHHHPHRQVLLMVTAPAVRPHPLLQIVEDLGNVELVYLDLDQVFAGPPLQSWHSQRLWLYIEERSSIFVSDAARVELLRRYGGTYLDLDALTLRPLPDLEPYVGRVSSTHAGNGVMSFPPRHPLIQAMADDLPRAFNPTECCSIGPYLITRHLHNWCPGNFTIPRNTSNRAKETCQDITIYPERAFCPIKWTPVLTELQGVFFNGMGLGAKFLKDASDVYSLHLYNSLSKEERVELKGDSIIEEVAKRNCPKVYDFLLTHNMAI